MHLYKFKQTKCVPIFRLFHLPRTSFVRNRLPSIKIHWSNQFAKDGIHFFSPEQSQVYSIALWWFLISFRFLGVVGKPTPATSSERIVSSAKNDAHKQAGSSGILTVRRKPGDWSCPTCFANNASSFNKCPCCDTPNPNAAQMPGMTQWKSWLFLVRETQACASKLFIYWTTRSLG